MSSLASVPLMAVSVLLALATPMSAGGRTAGSSADAVYSIPGWFIGGPPVSGDRTFTSRCYSHSVRLIAVGFPDPTRATGLRSTFVGSVALPVGPGKHPEGSFTISWNGTYTAGITDRFRGRGTGTWHASSLPAKCRRRSSTTAHGRLVLTWVLTNGVEIANLRLVGFSP